MAELRDKSALVAIVRRGALTSIFQNTINQVLGKVLTILPPPDLTFRRL